MSKRSTNYKKQIKFSLIYKLFALVSSFLVVRYSLEFLGIDQYGLWSLILAFINWMLFFDLGMANGVKNHVSKSLANDDIEDAQIYISTGYISLLIFSSVVYIILFISSFFVNWQIIFHTEIVTNSNLQITILTASFFILFNFVLSIIIAVFNATQNTSFIVLNQFFTQTLSLILIYILNIYADTNLIYMAIAYGFSIVLINISISTWFYKKNIFLVPSFIKFKKEKIQPILSLGGKFFILQMTVLILMYSDRMIITHLLTLKDVTTYDLLYKYFSTLLILHGIINTPLWSMYTEAYEKKDYEWIKKIFRKLNLLLLLYILIALIMIYFGQEFILLWTGNSEINIQLSNYLYMGLLVVTMIWHSIYAYFLNGIEKLNIQIVATVIAAIVNIPLSIYLVKYQAMGLNGILLSTVLSLLIFNISGTIQTYSIMKSWNRND